jgi:hypothetical protein
MTRMGLLYSYIFGESGEASDGLSWLTVILSFLFGGQNGQQPNIVPSKKAGVAERTATAIVTS